MRPVGAGVELEDLARAFGCDRGFVAYVDEERGSLRGVSGHNVPAELVASIDLRLDLRPSVMVAALETGVAQHLDAAAAGERLSEASRQLLVEAGFQHTLIVPLLGSEGAPYGVVALSRPTSFLQQEIDSLAAVVARTRAPGERPQASEHVAVEREWLRAMLDFVDDPVVVADESNEIVVRNQRAEHLFQTHEGDGEGRRHAIWLNNFMFTAALSSWKLEPAAREASREVTLVDPIEGSEIVFEVLARPATNYRDGSRGVVAVLKDVTQLRHAHEELARGRAQLQTVDEAMRVERDRLALVLRSTPMPIVVIGDDDPLTMNPAAERLFGRGGQVADRRQQLALANWMRLQSFIGQTRLEPGAPSQGEVRLVDPESEEWLEMAVILGEVLDAKGGTVGSVAVLQDIGQLRELERRRLAQVLFDSEKLAATGRVAASIAHELNNPLEAIQNSLYLLVEHTPDGHPDRRFLEVARSETARMSRILREMLGFFRPAPELAPTDLNALIRETETLLGKRIRSANVRVVASLDPSLPTIRASADQLKQVLLNLLLNAVDAMPEGGTISISTAREVGSRVSLPDIERVQLQVKDEGVGIAEDDVPHVFEPFFTRSRSKRPSGLGLWVSSGIVRAHGGTMQVRSVAGHGTTFNVVLPVAGPEQLPVTPGPIALEVP